MNVASAWRIRLRKAVAEDSTELVLSHAELRNLPEQVLTLGNLERLCLLENNLEQLPEDLGVALPKLTFLRISGNLIAALPSNLNVLEELYWANNELLTLPITVEGLSCLRVLDLSRNFLRSLPGIHVPRLEEIYLKVNRLTSVPVELFSSTSLTICDISSNAIEEIPLELLLMETLQDLDLSRNHLSSFPPVDRPRIWPMLKGLDLSYNVLEHLPEWLGKCQSLQRLHCYRNCIRYLPASLANCGELTEIWVHENRLVTIPLTWRHMSDRLWLRCSSLAIGPHVWIDPSQTVNMRELKNSLQRLVQLPGSLLTFALAVNTDDARNARLPPHWPFAAVDRVCDAAGGDCLMSPEYGVCLRLTMHNVLQSIVVTGRGRIPPDLWDLPQWRPLKQLLTGHSDSDW
jgi:Leucine-rich repeat (LRR) protein